MRKPAGGEGIFVSENQKECRCCRKPVMFGMLACREHWALLPQSLRNEIILAWHDHRLRDYAVNVRQADRIWQDLGIWRPGVPS